MTSQPIGLILEAAVIVLLMVTVGYCFVLNRKLSKLRSHQSELRDIVVQLNTATTTAEAAIAGLKQTTLQADQQLTDKLKAAARLSGELDQLARSGGWPGRDVPVRSAIAPGMPRMPGVRDDMSRPGDEALERRDRGTRFDDLKRAG